MMQAILLRDFNIYDVVLYGERLSFDREIEVLVPGSKFHQLVNSESYQSDWIDTGNPAIEVSILCYRIEYPENDSIPISELWWLCKWKYCLRWRSPAPRQARQYSDPWPESLQ